MKAEEMGSRGKGWTVDRLASCALLAGAATATAAFLVVELYDLDIWWHLTIGREILATGEVPRVDRWTVLGAGRPYHDSHWLFQAVAALAERVGGMVGVQGLMVFTWVLVLAACYKIARQHLSVEGSALLAFAVLFTSLERVLPRPELVTFAAFAWFLVWLGEERAFGPRQVARLALVQAIWTNAHGLFVLGPFAAACHALPAAFRARREGWKAWGGPLLALAAIAGATLLNPWGIGAWSYAYLLFTEAQGAANVVVGAVGELSSPFGAAARTSPAIWAYFALLVLAATAAIARLRRAGGRGGEVAAWTIVLTAAALSLSGRRNVALFAIAAVPVLAPAAALVRWPAALTGKGARFAAAAALAMIAWFPLSGRFYLLLELPARSGFGVTPSFFPHGLPTFLESIGFSGPVLASNTLGGFVTYHGWPTTIPLTDGRWEVQDPEQLQATLLATRSPGLWRGTVREHGLRGILLAHTSPEAAAILPEIARDPGWRPVYLDDAASFWLPAGFGPPGLAPLNLEDPSSLPAIHRPEDGLLVAAFAAASGSRDLELAALEKILPSGFRRAWILERVGTARLDLGQYDEAAVAFRDLLEERPRSEVALNELAFLAYRKGDLEEARALLERLIEEAPKNPEYRENLERVQESLGASGRSSREP